MLSSDLPLISSETAWESTSDGGGLSGCKVDSVFDLHVFFLIRGMIISFLSLLGLVLKNKLKL